MGRDRVGKDKGRKEGAGTDFLVKFSGCQIERRGLKLLQPWVSAYHIQADNKEMVTHDKAVRGLRTFVHVSEHPCEK